MFSAYWVRSLFAALLMIGLFTANAAAQRKKQIAVLDFDFATRDLGIASHTYGGQENLGRQIADKLMTGLFGLGTCHVIERSQLERVLREQNLGVAGRLDESTAAKVGRILGVDGLIIGNVSALELVDGPKNNRDTYWNPKNLKARIAINVRLVNTTTARVEFINEFVGISAPPQAPKSTKGEIVGGLISGILTNNSRSGQPVELKDEQIRDVVYLAVDSVVSKITTDLDRHFTNPAAATEAAPSKESLFNGRVLAINGPSVIIADIPRSAVRMGDRLYVRRGTVKRDKTTGKEFRFTEKIGEVEVVEIQDEVIVGSFSGTGPVQEGDIVTNSSMGAGTSSQISAGAQSPARPPEPPAKSAGSKNERSFTVNANQAWLDTGIDLQPEMNLQFQAEGVIRIDRGNPVTAAGRTGPARATGLPKPDAPAGALLTKVRYANGKDSAILVVGAKGSARTEPGEYGRLMLGINDSTLADNGGSFRVVVRW
ncbi:MAG: CsgG/HfaB family protein [Blastocatellia bacterium]